MSRIASSPAAAHPSRTLTGTDFATAFDGKLERTGTTLGYQLGTVLVATAMVLLPLAYFAIIAAAAWGVAWYATNATAMFAHARGRAVILAVVVYIAPLFAGAVLVVSMLLPLLWRSKKGPRPLWVDRREQPLLYAYVDRLCDAMRVPRPARIDVTVEPNASAHIDNGLFGLVSRRLVLTIGLPLAAMMDLRQFTGVIAHEFGHFAQGGSMRLHYVISRINGWFFRMAYGRSGVDDMLDGLTADGDTHWSMAIIVGLAKACLYVTRGVLIGLATVSHALSMHLSRQAEYDADRKAASVVGSDAMGDGLQALPPISVAGGVALENAQAGWNRRRAVPDDLVLLTSRIAREVPAEVKTALEAKILSEESSWFDTHPPLFKRVALLKKRNLIGVLKLDAPATVLFRDYDELCKLATIDLYQGVLGDELLAEHLHDT